MSVHGAKGLEAPIVILPDTSTRAQPLGVSLIDDLEDGLLWPPRKDEDCQASREAKEARKAAAERESSRLLYVALTRARDRLIVCGVEAPPTSSSAAGTTSSRAPSPRSTRSLSRWWAAAKDCAAAPTPVTLPDARAAERTSRLARLGRPLGPSGGGGPSVL